MIDKNNLKSSPIVCRFERICFLEMGKISDNNESKHYKTYLLIKIRCKGEFYIVKGGVVIEKAISGSGDQGTYPVKVCINDVSSVSFDSIVFPFYGSNQTQAFPLYRLILEEEYLVIELLPCKGTKKVEEREEKKMTRSFKPKAKTLPENHSLRHVA